MTPFTLKHFRYFDALARTGHFGRAAEACSISQPALSVQIKELERIVGAPLVERTARQVRLTTLGEEFLARARKVLDDVEEMSELVRSSDDPLQGRLRIGVIPTVAPYLLPKMMSTLAKEFPGLNVQPRESITKSLVEDLQLSRLDAIIAATPLSEPGLQMQPLFDEEFVLVRPEKDAGQPVPSPLHLQELKLLLLEEGHCFRDQALSLCNMEPSDPSLVMEGSSLSTLVQMVDADLGVTLLPEMAIALETKNTSVAIARFRDDRPGRSIGMLWRKSNPLGDQMLQLAKVIRSTFVRGKTA